MYGETQIFLSHEAFISIILSSVEVYKRECLGALLGMQTQGRIIVEHAIPFQAVKKRTFSEVESNWRKELKVNEVIPKLIHLQKLGYFHSHPQFGDKRGEAGLSPADKKSMQETEIEIVVAINDSGKSLAWAPSRNGLVGTLGQYHIRIAGFYKKKSGKIKSFKILCPYAVGFGYTFEK